MLYQKTLEIKYSVDVLVVGGGASGVAAAVSAARMGKKVLIVEASGSFGGLGTVGMVPAFAPFYDGKDYIVGGFGMELRKKVAHDVPLYSYFAPFDKEELKRAYDELVLSSGAEFLFFTTMCDVVTSKGHVEYVVLTSKNGLYAVKAETYIDCTGDGELVALGGGEYEIGDENGSVMPPTLCSMWDNFDFSEYAKTDVHAQLEKAIADGIFSREDRHLPGMFVRSGPIGGGNLGHIFGTNPTDSRSLSDAMVEGRAQMLEYGRFYREYVGGCRDLRLLSTAEILGVRESRRIKCDYTLTVFDFLARARFEDEIGRYCYPVDIHVMDTSREEYRRFRKEYTEELCYKAGESYGIPYRSLIPLSFDNVLTAGRCIGTDRQMEASVRVMPSCFITGEAAGVAAALAEKGDVRGVNLDTLRDRLRKNGAVLPK